MNAKQRTSFTGAMIRHWAIACVALTIAAVRLSAADDLVRIDFRNKIPGIVDAPVFDFDGLSGLESRFAALLSVGPDTSSFVLVGEPQQFQSGTNAGYWEFETPILIAPSPQPSLGQRILFRVLIVERVSDAPFPSWIFVAESKIYSLEVTNSVMPMVGLESFSLVPEKLDITRHANQVVIQWQYLAAARYELRSTMSLQPPVSWTPIFEWSGLGVDQLIFSVTNAVTTAPQFYRLERWRFP